MHRHFQINFYAFNIFLFCIFILQINLNSYLLIYKTFLEIFNQIANALELRI
jgi:hypothetical protein